jgi:hypothetical protein
MTLDEVADRFRNRPWPRNQRRQPSTYMELAAQTQEDSDPYIPGSWDAVAAA